MEQDIRDFFENEEMGKELPKSHRDEFLQKLEALKKDEKPKPNYGYLYRIAAALIVFVSVGYFALNGFDNTSESVTESPIEIQLKTVEKKYLASIHQEWQNFLSIAKDEKLIGRYKEKLKELDGDYQQISMEFKKDTNNTLIIEALIENLQTRLTLLKDIQDHINVLNQKNEQYETTI